MSTRFAPVVKQSHAVGPNIRHPAGLMSLGDEDVTYWRLYVPIGHILIEVTDDTGVGIYTQCYLALRLHLYPCLSS